MLLLLLQTAAAEMLRKLLLVLAHGVGLCGGVGRQIVDQVRGLMWQVLVTVTSVVDIYTM